jgi:sulfur-carrier protein
MFTLEVRLYASLRRYRPESGIGQPLPVLLEDGSTVGQLIDVLQVPREEVKVVFVNGRWKEEDDLLSDGDRVGIFPPIGGG